MEFSVSHEAYVFLCSAICGMFLGILYDVFRTVRRKCSDFSVLGDLQDILFWTFAAIIMLAVIFFANNGKVRWYEFLGVFLGMNIYIFTLSRIFLSVFGFILDIFLKIFKLFFKILLTPLVFLYNIVFRWIILFFKPFYKMFAKLRFRLYGFFKTLRRTAGKT